MNLTAIKKNFPTVIKRYIRDNPKALASRTALLGLTVFGLVTLGGGVTVLVGGGAATLLLALRQVLEAISGDIATGVIEDVLQEVTISDGGAEEEIDLERVMNAVENLDGKQQTALNRVTERLGVWEMTLREVLASQRSDLLLRFQQILEAWKDNLQPQTVTALNREILMRLDDLERSNAQIQSQLQTLQHTSDAANDRLKAQQMQIEKVTQQLQQMLPLLSIIEERSDQDHKRLAHIDTEVSMLRVEVAGMRSQIDRLLKDMSSHQLLSQSLTVSSRRRKRRRLSDTFLSQMNDELDGFLKD